MKLRIHDDLEEYEIFLSKIEEKDTDLQFWKKYVNILMSDDKCFLHFAKTGDDFWELHIAFDRSYRGKKSLNIIKQGINWMLDNKTSRVICGIPKDRLDVRMMANQVGFNKLGTENNNECYEIRR